MVISEFGTNPVDAFATIQNEFNCLFHFEMLNYFLTRLSVKGKTCPLKSEFFYPGLNDKHRW